MGALWLGVREISLYGYNSHYLETAAQLYRAGVIILLFRETVFTLNIYTHSISYKQLFKMVSVWFGGYYFRR